MADRSLQAGMTLESSLLAEEADRRFQAGSAEAMASRDDDRPQGSEVVEDEARAVSVGQELVAEARENGNLGADADEPPSEGRMCRICHGGQDEGRLISPCKCTGSIRFVHVQCLQQWQALSPNSKSFYECDTCKFKYRYARTSLARVVGSKLVLHVATLFLLVCIMFMVGYVGKLIEYGNHCWKLQELASVHEQLTQYLEEELHRQAVAEAYRAEGENLTAGERLDNFSDPVAPADLSYSETPDVETPEQLFRDEDGNYVSFWRGEDGLLVEGDPVQEIRSLIVQVANAAAETEKEWSWRWFAFGIDTAHWLYGGSIVGVVGFLASLASLPFTANLWWGIRWRSGGGGGGESQGVVLLFLFVMLVGLLKSFSLIYKRVRVRASKWLTSLESNILDIQTDEVGAS
eukprot:jgi/Mesvir1/8812/Mv02713-RA.1